MQRHGDRMADIIHPGLVHLIAVCQLCKIKGGLKLPVICLVRKTEPLHPFLTGAAAHSLPDLSKTPGSFYVFLLPRFLVGQLAGIDHYRLHRISFIRGIFLCRLTQLLFFFHICLHAVHDPFMEGIHAVLGILGQLS